MRRQTGNSNFGRRDRPSGSGSRFGASDREDRTERRDSGRSFGGRSSGGSGFGRRDAPLTMHRVTCDKCGKMCEVPFRPTGDKPVYCSDCFRKNNDKPERRESSHRDFEKPQAQAKDYSKELDEINEKLDKIIESLGL